MEPGGETRSARVPALDGLRGVAVAGVLVFHGGLTWAGGGFLGVSTFFTLSGFLITSLLLVEHETTGAIALTRFWARRARRLLPALALAIAGILVLGVLTARGQQAVRLPGDAVSALLYVANWRFVLGDQSYAALFAEPSPLQHAWSLAIEEQFYLLFPLLVIGVLGHVRSARRGLALVVGALTIGSVVLSGLLVSVVGADTTRVYYGTDTRAAELLVGALLACAIGGRPLALTRKGKRVLARIGTAAFALVLAGWVALDVDTSLLYRGGLGAYGLLTAVVIAAAHVPGPVRRLLSREPLRSLGLVSYGVYLYHWPVFLWVSPDRTDLDGAPLFALRVAITLTLAAASYRFVEQPIRTGARWRTRPATLAAPAVIAVLCAVALVAPIGAPTPRVTFAPVRSAAKVDQRAAEAAPPAPSRARAPSRAVGAHLPLAGPTSPAAIAATPPPPQPPVQRIMVVGDSVGMTLGRGIERWGAAHGVAVLNSARFWCAIVRGGEIGALLGKHSSPQCESWPDRWAADLDRFHPDVVVVLSTIWDVAGRRRPEWGPEFLGPGDPVFDRWVLSEWRTAAQLLGSRGARVVWLTDPCAREAPVDALLAYASTHYVRALAAGGVDMVDLRHHVCPDGTFTDTVDGVGNARPDGLHFSDPGADATARWLGPLLVDRGPDARVRS
jgi:peptidoglycan/LPS O-acetylase OafA/YrhL